MLGRDFQVHFVALDAYELVSKCLRAGVYTNWMLY